MQVVAPFDVDKLQKQYPATYHESMNTVLVQEALRYNGLLEVVAASLQECAKAVKGLVVMSPSLEAVSNSMYDNQVGQTKTALLCVSSAVAVMHMYMMSTRASCRCLEQHHHVQKVKQWP